MSPLGPILIVPLLGAALSVLPWPAWRRTVFYLTVVANAVTVAALSFQVHEHGYVVLQAGGWAAPYGITLIADTLAAVMLVLTAVLAIAAAVAASAPGRYGEDFRRYTTSLPAMLFLILGMNGLFLSGDLFNLYVWFELLLISSFALLVVGHDRKRLTGAVKYLTLGLLSSSVLLIGTAATYAATGTLNLADLATAFPALPEKTRSLLWVFFIVAFGSKAAIFPLFFWLPASYPHMPYPIGGFAAGILTKVGLYALARLSSLFGLSDAGSLRQWLLVVAALTMITGVLGAVAQKGIRRLLSFHIVSQVGYLLLALALDTQVAMAAFVFFLVHITLTKAALFYLAEPVAELAGNEDLYKMRGLYRRHPYMSILFLAGALSLAGIPPFSGFWAKLFVLHAAFESQAYVLGAVTLLVSLLTLYSMLKIWVSAFWQTDQPSAEGVRGAGAWLPLLPSALLTICVLIVAFGAADYWAVAMHAAEQLFSPHYAESVMKGGG